MTPPAVVFNPSKFSDPAKSKQEICRALEANGFSEPLWLETTRDDPGVGQTEKALADDVTIVFVAGGDGTVNAVAGVLAGTEVALAVLPAGTGNLLARNFDVPRNLAAAVRVGAQGAVRRIDVGQADDRRFVIMAGMGFDAQMLADAPEKLKSAVGWLAYLVSAARHLLEPRRTFTLVLDDAAPIRRRGRGVLVGNVGQLQGGLPILPQAQPDDGVLDVAVIRAKGLVSWILLATDVVLRRGGHRLETFQARTAEVTCDEKVATEVDGELLDASDRLQIAVLPRALSLCVPVTRVPGDNP